MTLESKAAKWAVKTEMQVAVSTAIVADTIILLVYSLCKMHPKSIARGYSGYCTGSPGAGH